MHRQPSLYCQRGLAPIALILNDDSYVGFYKTLRPPSFPALENAMISFLPLHSCEQIRFCREFWSCPISGMIFLCDPDWTREGEHR